MTFRLLTSGRDSGRWEVVPHLALTARALRDVLVRPHRPGHTYRFHGGVSGTALTFGDGGTITCTSDVTGPTRQSDPADATRP
ncbi:hypothetical protein [Streptomyces sp. NPDC048057]|uniref:hypothetical protein n=1 Tax=Streptomyces sp. NPDC048057 TaxID=3155628 RepID=UPI0033FD22BB